MTKRQSFHVVDPKTERWYHIDENFNVWSCSCTEPSEKQLSLCLTIDESLKREGELRDLDRQIALKRKQLGLKPGEPL